MQQLDYDVPNNTGNSPGAIPIKRQFNTKIRKLQGQQSVEQLNQANHQMATDAYFAVDYGGMRQKTLNETEIKSKNLVAAKSYSIGNKQGKGANLPNPNEVSSSAVKTQGGTR